MKWHLLEVHRSWNLVVTAVEGCRLLCRSPALAQLSFPSLLLAWLGTFLPLSVNVQVRNSSLLTQKFFLPLSDYNESRQLSPVLPPFKSL